MKTYAVTLLLLAAACGPSGGPGLKNIVVTHPVLGCDVTTGDADDTTRGHHAPCESLTYDTEPPCHGDHYSVWADYKTYTAPVPWPFLVHDMEHGGVVLAYRPGSEIPDIAARLQTFVDTYPADPLCGMDPWRSRLIIVPDPTLDVPFAAAAWQHVYRATCFDEASLHAFVDAHYARTTEDFCEAYFDGETAPGGWCGSP